MVNLLAAVGQLWTSVSWSDLPSSFHYTLGETVPLPFSSLFCLYRGTDVSTKDSVSIFVYSKTGNGSCVSNDKKDTTCLAFIQNAFKYSKTLRHPYIVRVLEAVETSTGIYIVTESVSPLCLCYNKADPSWGLYRILNAIHFLHESCHVTHNLISPWSIFVTEKESQWCLGLFDGIHAINKPQDNVAALTHPLYNIYTQSLPLATPGSFTLDRFRLASLVYWCYSKPHNTNLEKFVAVTHTSPARDSLPHGVDELCYSLYPYEHLKSLSLLKSIKVIVNESRVFRETGLVQIMLFFEECHLQPDFEKYAFFKNLPESLRHIDLEVQYENVLPQLKKQIGLLKNPEALLPNIFYISENVKRHASQPTFQHVYYHSILPILIFLLKKPERGIRFFMLQHLNHFKDFLNSDHVEDVIEPICLGFHDSVPELRNATLESMLVFLPKLTKTKLQDKVFLHILNLLRHDTKPSIRVNALGCILHLIHSNFFSRHEKTLLSCILGALRDPISQCRIAALELLKEWLKSPLCALDYTTLITHLLTPVTENCLDQDDIIKQRAIVTLEHLVIRAKHLLSVTLSHTLGDASNVDQVALHQCPSFENSVENMEKTKQKQLLACHHEIPPHQNSLSKLVMESNITDSNSGTFSAGLNGIDQVEQSNQVNISPKYTEESEQFFDAEDDLQVTSTPPGFTNITTYPRNSPQETCREEVNNSCSPQDEPHTSTTYQLSDRSLLTLADLNKSFWKNCPVTDEKSTSKNVNPTVNAVKQLIAARKNI